MCAAPVDSIDHPDGDYPDSHGISVSELAAFAGDSKYPARWLARLEKRSSLAGFNIWATLFGIQWFFYRKLYFLGLFSIFLEIGVPYLFAVLIVSMIGRGQVATALICVSIVGVRVAIGYWANVALYNEAVRTIREIDSMNLDNETHLRRIAAVGGVSVPSLIIIYLTLGALRFAFPRIWTG